MTSKEAVKRCIHFGSPAFLPVLYFNKDKEKSDILLLDYHPPASFTPAQKGEDEWGSVWDSCDDGTMGQPREFPLAGHTSLEGYTFPVATAKGRFDGLADTIAANKDKYVLGGLRLSGFTVMSNLCGFSEALENLYLEPEFSEALLEQIAAFEMGVIEEYAKLGADGIAFYDDWGSQQNLFINPEKWREVFKPVYKKQFELVHQLGLDVYFHCCGNIRAIIDDLIEIGVDVLNLNQPDIFPLEYLSTHYKGKLCFNCPVDHQTEAIHGDDASIHRYVERMCQLLASPTGGYFGYIEEYSSVGMSGENYASICDAFAKNRLTAYN